MQAVARGWLDVPVMHMQASKAGGVDCINLVVEVGIEAAVLPAEAREDPRLRKYGRLPNPDVLIDGLSAHMLAIPKEEAGPADVVALSWGDREAPMHMAILAQYKGRTTVILAYPHLRLKIGEERRKPRVREITYGADWPDRALSWWRYPGLVV